MPTWGPKFTIHGDVIPVNDSRLLCTRAQTRPELETPDSHLYVVEHPYQFGGNIAATINIIYSSNKSDAYADEIPSTLFSFSSRISSPLNRTDVSSREVEAAGSYSYQGQTSSPEMQWTRFEFNWWQWYVRLFGCQDQIESRYDAHRPGFDFRRLRTAMLCSY